MPGWNSAMAVMATKDGDETQSPINSVHFCTPRNTGMLIVVRSTISVNNEIFCRKIEVEEIREHIHSLRRRYVCKIQHKLYVQLYIRFLTSPMNTIYT